MAMNKPIAVLISDIHYSLPTLELADNAMRQAIFKADELKIPLIVAGDLHDTKANLRGECVNRMLETFMLVTTECYILRGNHDQINEKSEEHSLNFLKMLPGIVVIDRIPSPQDVRFIPYQHDTQKLRAYLKTIKKGSTIIMHQGIEGSNSGDYIQDKSAINPEDVAGMRVISGHYHTRQTIKLPDGGTWDYIGNPYTLNYGEANDPPKGFQILMNDGSLEFIPTNLRKHVVIDFKMPPQEPPQKYSPGDLVWVKFKGSRTELTYVSKKQIGEFLGLTDFKLTLEPTDLNIKISTKQLSNTELLDSLIDSTDTTPETKGRLKSTWKSLCES